MSDSGPVNFFGGSPLNRLSWLRSSQQFLNAILLSPSTHWLIFRDGQPLMASQSTSSSETGQPSRSRSLARLVTSDIRPLLGQEPFFSQGKNEGEIAADNVTVLEAARLKGPPIVFLGLHEPQSDSGFADALPSSDFSAKADPSAVVAKIRGTPYFSLDVSDVDQAELERLLQASETGKNGAKLAFMDARAAMGSFDYFDSAIVASARSLVDWNARNKFCSACGSPVYSLWAGWKLSCSTLLPWADNSGRKPCPTASGLHNFAHPRSDAVVIVAVINEANDKVLLGRSRKWPGKFYSAMAGFIEPGEALEDAVKRELWEEAGVKVWGIKYHSTQPWPFPANLMVGFYATADPSIPTRTDLDNELEDAKWFTREEILAVLAHPHGTKIGSLDPSKPIPKEADRDEPGFRLPPISAIAGVLLSDWAHGKVSVSSVDVKPVQKGNL